MVLASRLVSPPSSSVELKATVMSLSSDYMVDAGRVEICDGLYGGCQGGDVLSTGCLYQTTIRAHPSQPARYQLHLSKSDQSPGLAAQAAHSRNPASATDQNIFVNQVSRISNERNNTPWEAKSARPGIDHRNRRALHRKCRPLVRRGRSVPAAVPYQAPCRPHQVA